MRKEGGGRKETSKPTPQGSRRNNIEFDEIYRSPTRPSNSNNGQKDDYIVSSIHPKTQKSHKYNQRQGEDNNILSIMNNLFRFEDNNEGEQEYVEKLNEIKSLFFSMYKLKRRNGLVSSDHWSRPGLDVDTNMLFCVLSSLSLNKNVIVCRHFERMNKLRVKEFYFEQQRELRNQRPSSRRIASLPRPHIRSHEEEEDPLRQEEKEKDQGKAQISLLLNISQSNIRSALMEFFQHHFEDFSDRLASEDNNFFITAQHSKCLSNMNGSTGESNASTIEMDGGLSLLLQLAHVIHRGNVWEEYSIIKIYLLCDDVEDKEMIATSLKNILKAIRVIARFELVLIHKEDISAIIRNTDLHNVLHSLYTNGASCQHCLSIGEAYVLNDILKDYVLYKRDGSFVGDFPSATFLLFLLLPAPPSTASMLVNADNNNGGSTNNTFDSDNSYNWEETYYDYVSILSSDLPPTLLCFPSNTSIITTAL